MTIALGIVTNWYCHIVEQIKLSRTLCIRLCTTGTVFHFISEGMQPPAFNNMHKRPIETSTQCETDDVSGERPQPPSPKKMHKSAQCKTDHQDDLEDGEEQEEQDADAPDGYIKLQSIVDNLHVIKVQDKDAHEWKNETWCTLVVQQPINESGVDIGCEPAPVLNISGFRFSQLCLTEEPVFSNIYLAVALETTPYDVTIVVPANGNIGPAELIYDDDAQNAGPSKVDETPTCRLNSVKVRKGQWTKLNRSDLRIQCVQRILPFTKSADIRRFIHIALPQYRRRYRARFTLPSTVDHSVECVVKVSVVFPPEEAKKAKKRVADKAPPKNKQTRSLKKETAAGENAEKANERKVDQVSSRKMCPFCDKPRKRMDHHFDDVHFRQGRTAKFFEHMHAMDRRRKHSQ